MAAIPYIISLTLQKACALPGVLVRNVRWERPESAKPDPEADQQEVHHDRHSGLRRGKRGAHADSQCKLYRRNTDDVP